MMTTKPKCTTPFDAAEIVPCAACGEGVMHDGSIVFYELTMRSVVADLSAIRTVDAMERLFAGNAAIARAMSPTTTVARRLPANRVLICASCASEPQLPLRFIGE